MTDHFRQFTMGWEDLERAVRDALEEVTQTKTKTLKKRVGLQAPRGPARHFRQLKLLRCSRRIELLGPRRTRKIGQAVLGRNRTSNSQYAQPPASSRNPRHDS